jgi:hypothetical protein
MACHMGTNVSEKPAASIFYPVEHWGIWLLPDVDVPLPKYTAFIPEGHSLVIHELEIPRCGAFQLQLRP